MKKITVIVGGGSGKRMSSSTPKQFLILKGKPMWMHAIEKFYAFDNEMELRLVLPKEYLILWEQQCKENAFNILHSVYPGGNTRFHSVKSGLQNIRDLCLIAIHDAARPLVSQQTIKNCFDLAGQKGSAIPLLPLTESLRKISGTGSESVDRTLFRIVQTPQVFRSDILLKSYNSEFKPQYTDDASVVEANNYPVFITEGNEENIKITSPQDFLMAEQLMNKEF